MKQSAAIKLLQFSMLLLAYYQLHNYRARWEMSGLHIYTGYQLHILQEMLKSLKQMR